uniref:Col_cuticle_N domain-containing protein n=1 Tax=Rhabditophanes sp. KR3021 TaxID=114890 RepID=A0AC35UAZ5_9BILA
MIELNNITSGIIVNATTPLPSLLFTVGITSTFIILAVVIIIFIKKNGPSIDRTNDIAFTGIGEEDEGKRDKRQTSSINYQKNNSKPNKEGGIVEKQMNNLKTCPDQINNVNVPTIVITTASLRRKNADSLDF